MFISSCSQEDSNPMFETNSETHINNLESKALPSVLVTIWIRKQVSFGQYVAITGDGAELGHWTPANSIPLLEDANQENYHSASVYLLKGKTYEFKPLVLNRGDKSVVEWGDDPNIVISLPSDFPGGTFTLVHTWD